MGTGKLRRLVLAAAASSAAIAATPSLAADSGFYYRYKGTFGLFDSVAVSLGIATLDPAEVGEAWSYPFSSLASVGSGGTVDQLTWSASGSVPGLGLDTDSGTLLGNPTTEGAYTIVVRADHPSGESGQRQYEVVVVPPLTITLNGGTLPTEAKVGQVYTYNFKPHATVAGGKTSPTADNLTWSKSPANALPWLSLDAATGIASGTPTDADLGDKTFDVVATHLSKEGQATYTIKVGQVVLEVLQIALTDASTCVLTTDHGVKCWGAGGNGQLGNGAKNNSNVPVDVSGLQSNVSYIGTGANHACAVTSAGALWCWGRNDSSQLGDGTTGESSTPVLVQGLGTTVSKVDGGVSHTCALTTAGGLKCWGSGWLGNGGSVSRSPPVDIYASGITAFSTGVGFTCAVRTDGTVWCWGDGSYGQLGYGVTNTYSVSPVKVTNIASGATDVTTGAWHACAIVNTGLQCWGYNSDGQLGRGSPGTNLPHASWVSGMGSGVTSVSAGTQNTCAIRNGSAFCWGNNGSRQIGDNTTTPRSFPGSDLAWLSSGVSTMVAGTNHACAVLTSGSVKCWGGGLVGQLGNGASTGSGTPVDVRAQ